MTSPVHSPVHRHQFQRNMDPRRWPSSVLYQCDRGKRMLNSLDGRKGTGFLHWKMYHFLHSVGVMNRWYHVFDHPDKLMMKIGYISMLEIEIRYPWTE